MSPLRIQRQWGQPLPPGAVYVGRPSRWGNPFWIYRGHTACGPSWQVARESWRHLPVSACQAAYVTSSRTLGPEAALEPYRTLLQVRLRDEPERLREWLAPLAGWDLACWCPVGQPCHADVLLEIANETATPA